MPTSRFAGPCIVACALLGCTDRSAPPVEAVIDTVQGVIRVANPADSRWSPDEHWELRETLRIGSVEARPGEFFTNVLMTPVLGQDGSIYVLEHSNPRVAVFDRTGTFVGQISRGGRGPGELSSPTGVMWDAYGRLWIADAWGAAYKIFSKDGQFLESRTRPVTVVSRRQHPLSLAPDGGIVDEASDGPMLYMLHVDSATGAVDTVARARRPDRPSALSARPSVRGSAISQVARSYLPSLQWAYAPNGSHWVTRTDSLRLLNIDENGDTLRIVETSHREASYTPDEENLISEAVSESGLSRDELGVSKEIVSGLHVLSDGHLLVQIAENEGSSTVFDVFDPEGRYLGELDVGFRIAFNSLFTTTGDTLLAVTTDSLDVPYVVRSVIDRRR